MPTFFIIEGVKIELFYNDHVPPHFHATIAEYEALIAIKSQEIIRGDLPKNKKKKILKWSKENESILMEIWNSMRSSN
jgi:hypothetical protein